MHLEVWEVLDSPNAPNRLYEAARYPNGEFMICSRSTKEKTLGGET